MKLPAIAFGIVVGILITYYFLRPRPTLDYTIASKENVALHVKAHYICYSSLIAEWARMDSTYIPLDSLEEVYLRTCGDYVENIKQE